MATDRDRLNQLGSSLNSDQEPGLQQILEPSVSGQLPPDRGQHQVPHSARRKTIYTRTELFNRTDLNDMPQTSCQPTVPPKQSLFTASTSSLTQMPTEIDVKEEKQCQIKKTQSDPNTQYSSESIMDPLKDCGLKQPKEMPGTSSSIKYKELQE